MAHIHEKIDFTAEVFIVHKNKVLLRMHDKYHLWLSVGGHIELDEDPNQAAIREVKEEVGLDVELWNGNQPHQHADENFKELIPPVGLNRHRATETHEHVTLIYFARSSTDKLVLSEHEKSVDCRWLTKEELTSLDLHPHVRYYANLALETLSA